VLAKRCNDVVVHAAVSPEVLMVLNGPARRVLASPGVRPPCARSHVVTRHAGVSWI